MSDRKTLNTRTRLLGRYLPFGTAALFLAVLLTGCSEELITHGDKLDADRLARISPGTQNRDDVAAILGSPSSTATFNSKTWYYISATQAKRSIFDNEIVDRQIVVIHFNDEGTVHDVEQYGLERGKEVELVERETPSFGESVSIVQQMIGNLGRFNDADTKGQRR